MKTGRVVEYRPEFRPRTGMKTGMKTGIWTGFRTGLKTGPKPVRNPDCRGAGPLDLYGRYTPARQGFLGPD